MKATRIIVICTLFVAAVVMAVFCVKSVTTPIKFEDTRAAREVEVIKHLVDLRTAEVEYHHQNGKFIASADTLLIFLKTAPKKEVMKEGSLTDKQLEGGLTETKAVKIIEAAKAKALKNKKLNLDPADKDALYAYIWANDADIKKNNLQGFRRDTIELNMLQALYKGKYDETTIDTIVKIPYGNGTLFEIEVNNTYSTSQGIIVPIMAAKAHYKTYLSDLNRMELINLIDKEEKLEHYPGLMFGSVDAPNNNAGNWE